MDLAHVAEIRTVISLLDALSRAREGTVRDLCASTNLSRSAVDKGLRLLLMAGLVTRDKRSFGRAALVVLTEQGADAALYAKCLGGLLVPARQLTPSPSDAGPYRRTA